MMRAWTPSGLLPHPPPVRSDLPANLELRAALAADLRVRTCL
ncbi:hypothetical protein SLNWT_7087 [Streptomyces albus]|uniref:Uncharacterized protein n=1 Tax=Streptomyces albus (strain ATCC 21838 / DSM 41398 / FERM P-419 / JCM 4703 / NBRC 107858) TaxID=1081613 RepID=A0A0B5EXC1_STRA4|nr:hypothetical protein SLNWT_7087 [Streptomyces albus]AOU81767.1 hypothetical protein SLNHY_7076 [Streptomyces albus]AYN37455.1 hypothetical protein DUI70_6962 [Streptomyces albus]